MPIEKIPFVKNLIDSYTKTLIGKVFDCNGDNIGVKYAPNLLL